MNRYATGDDLPVTLFLERNGAPDLLAGDTVTCALLVESGTRASGTADVAATIDDVATGQVTATWPAGQTAALPAGRYIVEAQRLRSGAKLTFRSGPIELYVGVIP